jgi:hypothetical protein
MATKVKNYNISPYFDDFDESKGYQRILFKPGVAVQARELTQLQTALQAQIDRHGRYAFKDGSKVVNGEVSLDVNFEFIKIESAFTHTVGGAVNTDAYLSEFVGSTITGLGNSGNQITAKVIAAIAAEGSDPNTLYVKYGEKGGATGNRTVDTFAASEEFTSNTSTTSGTVRHGKIKTSGVTPIGKGSRVNIEEGVYFIAGNFVHVPAGSLILDKYTNTPNYIVGLSVTETLAGTAQDSTLNDNATGTPNFAAPGADRYKIATSLIKQPLDLSARTEDSYIPLVTITNGKKQIDETDKTNDAALGRRLATRTFEESGDYSVNPIELNIREHLDDGAGNGGLILSGDGGSADKLAIGVEPAVTYVKGFRKEHTDTQYVAVDKPRGTDATNNVNYAATQVKLGAFIKLQLSGLTGLPDLDTFRALALKNGSNATIGSARARGLDIVSNASHAKLYLFDIRMTGTNTFNNVRSVSQTDSGSPATQAFAANILLTASQALLEDTGNSSLVYKLPFDAIKTLNQDGQTTTDNIIRVREHFKATATGTNVTFTISGGPTFVDTTNNVLSPVGAATKLTNGTAAGGYEISSSSTTSITIAGVPSGAACELIATVQKNVDEKTKTRLNSQTVTGSLNGGTLGIGKADVIRINSITDSNNVNVTDQFTLDNGQRDTFYDLAKIVLKPGFANIPGTLSINYDYYTHGAGNYISADSYPPADYATIGTFNSSRDGEVSLRDCIDFRPRIADNGTDFTSTGGSVSQAPNTNHTVTSEITYYMKRIDKLYVNKLGEYKVEKGVPADSPKAPKTPDDTMGVYDLHLNPFVYNLDDVRPVIIDNKRFTMRDIGKLEKRVKNLEYYVSLSLLEQNAADAHIVDSSGLSRFKNGFLVDSFRGHQIGDASNPDYNISMDKGTGTARPKFDERSTNLVRKAGDSGTVVVNGSLGTMKRASTAEVNYINQPYASQFVNVNPYNVFDWTGILELSPDSDEWKDVDVRPSIFIDDTSQYDQFKTMADATGILGTVWNEWETNWTGVDVSEDTNVTRERVRGRGIKVTTTTQTTTQTTQGQARSGLRTDLGFDTITKESGDRVVEVNFAPFIRSREVFFKADQMKPKSKVFVFFDGTDITAYAKQKAYVEFSSRSSVVEHAGLTSHYDSGSGALETDINGSIAGSVIIPNSSSLRFKTGSRTFRLTDNAANNKELETTSADAIYTAAGLIESKQRTITSTKVPVISTTELNSSRTIVDTSVSTHETVEWIDPVAESFLIQQEGGLFASSIDIFFQSKNTENVAIRLEIREMQDGNPTQRVVPGSRKVLLPAQVTPSADATQATNFAFDYPVYLSQDREYAVVLISQCDDYNVWVAEMGGFDVTNTSERITKQPYNGVFFTSANASTWTPEQSKDLKFKLNRADFDISTHSEITLVNDILPNKTLPANPLATTQNSGVITVNHPNHGMYAGSTIVVSGAGAINGIAANNINGSHVISNITHDGYTITAANSDLSNNNATTGVGPGGGTSVVVQENRHMDVMNLYAEHLKFPDTDIRFFATIMNSTTAGQGGSYSAGTEFEVLPGKNVIFASPRTIAHSAQETATLGSGGKSFVLRCRMTSTKSHLSPVIDMNRFSVVSVQNRISNTNSNEGTVARGGDAVSKYITKKVDLKDEADIIKAYLSVNLPTAGSVRLYWRVLQGDGTVRVNNVDYTEMNDVPWTEASPIDPITFNDNPSEFAEAEYSIDPLGANVSFGAMQFKVVLNSTNSSRVPLLKDFRAIAAT